MMRFRIGRTEVRISIGALPLFAFCIVAGELRALLLAGTALAVHELSHAIAIKNLGGRTARISVYPFGAVMTPELPSKSAEWVIALAGPLGSFALSAMLSLTETFGLRSAWAGDLNRTSLAIGLLNLVPAFPLDGGRLFRTLLSETVRARTAKTMLLLFTSVFACGSIGAGVYLALRGVYAWTLFLLPPFLVYAAVSEWKTPDAGAVSRAMERKTALRSGSPQKVQIVVLPQDASVGDAVCSIARSRYTIFRVQTEGGSIELTEDDALDAAAKSGLSAPIKSVFSGLTAGK